MKKIIYILMIMTAITLTGCEKVVEFDIDETDAKVVMVAKAVSDSTLSVRLSMSRFFLSNNDFKLIDDATLSLTQNGVPVASPQYKDGYYKFALRPQPGDTLHLDVNVPGKDPISAGTRVPQKPCLDNCSISGSVGYNNQIQYRFRLQDPANESTAYCFSSYIIDTVDYDTIIEYSYDYYTGTYRYDTILPHTEVFKWNVQLNTDDPLLSNTDVFDAVGEVFDGEEYYYDKLCLQDDAISGTSHEFTFKGKAYYYGSYYGSYSSAQEKHHAHIFLQVASYSKGLYLFETTCQSQYDSDELTGMFSEPVQIHCNVVGGIGIFGAYTVNTIEKAIDLNKKK